MSIPPIERHANSPTATQEPNDHLSVPKDILPSIQELLDKASSEFPFPRGSNVPLKHTDRHDSICTSPFLVVRDVTARIVFESSLGEAPSMQVAAKGWASCPNEITCRASATVSPLGEITAYDTLWGERLPS